MLGVMLGLRAACQTRRSQMDGILARRPHGLPCSDAFARRFSELWIRSNHSSLFGTHDFDAKLLAGGGRHHCLCILEFEHLS